MQRACLQGPLCLGRRRSVRTLELLFGVALAGSPSRRRMSGNCALPSRMVSAANVRFLANAAPARRLIRPAPPTDRRTIAICQAACSIRQIARNSVHVRRLWAALAVDELPGGNHRRDVPCATRGDSAYRAYGRTTSGGGGWGPGHTGNVGAAHRSRPFALLRKIQPSSPSACRAAASRSARHAA